MPVPEMGRAWREGRREKVGGQDVNGFMVAGVASGVGKTTITVGLISALRRRGLAVQPFKTGPDYIDPTYHTRAAGVPSRNLDTWMVPHAHVTELFGRAMAGKDVAVVEGVMGLHDSRSATSEEGSGAELARLLGLPVILVVDASAVGRSVAATVLGFQRFDPRVRFAGVVLNRVAGTRHAALCSEAILAATGLPVLGALAREDRIRLPERHLGLVPTVEGATPGSVFDEIASAVGKAIDIQRLLDVTAITLPSTVRTGLFPEKPIAKRARIAVAMDRAFSFYYQDSLDLLDAWGAELAPFSIMEDAGLPEGTSGVYIGGGFPEVYAKEIAANRAVAMALQRAASAGAPIYAECGDLMYLGRALVDFEGVAHPMAGLLPLTSRLTETRLSLGYRTVRAVADGPVLCQGQEVRAHEFHWSRLQEQEPAHTAAYHVVDQDGRAEGYRQGSILASYMHLHLAADQRLALRFVEYCHERKRKE